MKNLLLSAVCTAFAVTPSSAQAWRSYVRSQGSVHAGVTVLGRLKLGGQSKGFTSVAYGLRCGPSPIEGDLD